ncbi:uncharacterized protein LOC131859305 [Cryptomeria japonica]|uniref:uncharacterized protein LOC131859305 n=1 Tax=Cryptomeria japonica TaxID=3369 RepID=UPI0027DA6AC0|nr:uncharacterized protein LOC131859305 [Cryptomeria japonica]
MDAKKDPIIILDKETMLSGATSTNTGEEKIETEKKDEEKIDEEMIESLLITQIEYVQTTAPPVRDKEKEEEKDKEKTKKNVENKAPKKDIEMQKEEEILPTPIDKLEHLVTSLGEQMKSLEEASIKNVEKEYKKRRIEQLMKENDRDRVGLAMNLEQIKEALWSKGAFMQFVWKKNMGQFKARCEKRKSEQPHKDVTRVEEEEWKDKYIRQQEDAPEQIEKVAVEQQMEEAVDIEKDL